MKTLIMEVELLTPCLAGSGTGFGSLIDTDIVFDEMGIPFIPAKRIKGCLRDSATEICEYFERAGINYLDLSKDGKDYRIITKTFGRPGEEEPADIYFSNLYIDEYKKVSEWLDYLQNTYSSIINRESVFNYFTELREHTAIDEDRGTAKEHSLRTIRVIKKGSRFKSTIDVLNDSPEVLELLYYGAKNLRHMGTKRTRGFGYVRCKLFEDKKELNYMDKLEALCNQ